MAENITDSATDSDDVTIAELEAALATLKAAQKAKADKKKEERRQREQEAWEAKVHDYRKNNVEEFVGSTREWLAINGGFVGGVELTIYEGLISQLGITLSDDDARKLRDILTERLG